MSRNIEIKAWIENRAELEQQAAVIADSGPEQIHQDDMYFNCQSGRLKLRTFSENSGELIFYQREDDAGPKESFYLRSATGEPDTLRECLARAHGVLGRVIKERTLYMAGRTRIHIDQVRDLGDFIELEVVLEEGEDAYSGMQEANKLLRRLRVKADQLVEGSYLDLMATAVG